MRHGSAAHSGGYVELYFVPSCSFSLSLQGAASLSKIMKACRPMRKSAKECHQNLEPNVMFCFLERELIPAVVVWF